MALFMIGLGLSDMKDISIKGLDAISKCDIIYLEHYTAVLHTTKDELEDYFNKSIIVADRNMVEVDGDRIVDEALEHNVAFLVVGDPFVATTHSDLFLRAKSRGVVVRVVHNASIINAVGVVGLELYKYGKTTSIVFPDDDWLPETPYDVIKQNLSCGFHTLCLLDIKVSEPSRKDLLRGVNNPLPPRFMSVKQGLEVLERIEAGRNEGIITPDTTVVGVARIGSDDPVIKAGPLSVVKEFDFGGPMHSIIIPAKQLHHVEEEMLSLWK